MYAQTCTHALLSALNPCSVLLLCFPSVVQTFLEHTHEEEHVMLPALRGELQEAQLRDLGKRFEAAKQHMPTRHEM